MNRRLKWMNCRLEVKKELNRYHASNFRNGFAQTFVNTGFHGHVAHFATFASHGKAKVDHHFGGYVNQFQISSIGLQVWPHGVEVCFTFIL